MDLRPSLKALGLQREVSIFHARIAWRRIAVGGGEFHELGKSSCEILKRWNQSEAFAGTAPFKGAGVISTAPSRLRRTTLTVPVYSGQPE